MMLALHGAKPIPEYKCVERKTMGPPQAGARPIDHLARLPAIAAF
jgi:hypothetical protein